LGTRSFSMLRHYAKFHNSVGGHVSCSKTYWHPRKEEWKKETAEKCSSKRAVVSRRIRKFRQSLPLFFLVTLVLLRKKRAHKYGAEATSDRLVKATRTVHVSHPRKPVTTDSALISLGRAIHDERSIIWRFISVVLSLPLLSRFLFLLLLLYSVLVHS